MKKLIAVILSMAMIGTFLGGCSKDAEAEPTPTPTSTVESEMTETPAETQAPGTEQPAATDNSGNTAASDSKPTGKPASNTTQKPVSNNSSSSQAGGSDNQQTAEQPSAPATEAPSTAQTVSLSQLMDSMIGALPAGSYSLSRIPDEYIGSVYLIDKSKFEDVLIYGSLMGAKSNEIILIKAKDSTGVSEAKNLLQNRKDKLIEQWKSYLPEQYELVKQSQIVSDGMYVAFVCASGQDQAVSAFHAALK